MRQRNRDQETIWIEILEIAAEPVTKSKLRMSVDMNLAQTHKHVDLLTDQGYLRLDAKGRYETSQEGKHELLPRLRAVTAVTEV